MLSSLYYTLEAEAIAAERLRAVVISSTISFEAVMVDGETSPTDKLYCLGDTTAKAMIKRMTYKAQMNKTRRARELRLLIQARFKATF